jgi:hypothetical protein
MVNSLILLAVFLVFGYSIWGIGRMRGGSQTGT